MRYFGPDTNSPAGGNPARPSSSTIPSDMDSDVNADEEVIDQRGNDPSGRTNYPRRANASALTPDDSSGSATSLPDAVNTTQGATGAPGHHAATGDPAGEPLNDADAVR